MARKKHFYLDIESIPSVIDDYFKANTQYEHEIAKNDDSGLLLKIKKGNSTGILNLFYSKGRVSYSVQGRMKEKAEECWNYIKQQTALPNTEHKTYTIKDVSKEDFNEYKNVWMNMSLIPLKIWKHQTQMLLTDSRLQEDMRLQWSLHIIRMGRCICKERYQVYFFLL